jgi:hypothetical protein
MYKQKKGPTKDNKKYDNRKPNNKYDDKKRPNNNNNYEKKKEPLIEMVQDLNCSICSCVKKTKTNMYPCDHGLCDTCNPIIIKKFEKNCPICINIKV